jgi:hypothetical protein
MDPLRHLLWSNDDETFNFFLGGLSEVTNRPRSREDKELMYVTSVLAHFAGPPPCSRKGNHTPGLYRIPLNLTEVFDEFVLNDRAVQDSFYFEAGASKSLLLAGFFRRQMKRRHNVEWYDQVGSSLYLRASRLSDTPSAAWLYFRLSQSFAFWTLACSELQKHFYEEQFLVRPS